jgi:hypothetical protein
MDVAEGWSDGRPMELWNRDRRLKRWDYARTLPD